MASWSTSAAVAAPARPRREPASQPTPRRRPVGQRRLRGAVLWIAGVALLLGGVVALSVGVLQLNMRLDRLDDQRARLRAENAALQSQLSSAQAVGRIQARATRLGLVPAAPEDTSYLQLTP